MVTTQSTTTTSTKPTDFQREFERLAVNGCIGDPSGKPAYAYLRVSSDGQADEGRSGLPRQIEHCHVAAKRDGYAITLDRVFADDYSGLTDFEARPELSRLRREYKSTTRRATTVVFEHLDRLSRKGWHQDFLLQEMRDFGVQAVFFKQLGSRIERAVTSAISEEGMQDAKERMRLGFVKKAERGEITSRRRLYGYQFVDSKDANGKIRRKTGYVIDAGEARIVERIFSMIAAGGTLTQVATTLTNDGVQPPGRARYWAVSTLSEMIKNPAYKGQYVHGRHATVDALTPSKDGVTFQSKRKRVITDESQQIVVPVPAIVTPELWQRANDQITRNWHTSRRNAKKEYLLSGLLKCAHCGYAFHGKRSRDDHGVYRCSSNTYGAKMAPQRPGGLTCDAPSVSVAKLDAAVWETIFNILTSEYNLQRALAASFDNEANRAITAQVNFLEEQVNRFDADDERLTQAYLAGAFDASEFADQRRALKDQRARLQTELARLKPQQVTPEQFEEQKQFLIEVTRQLRDTGVLKDVSFELKKKVLRQWVDRIDLDTRTGTFTITGSIGRLTIMGVVWGTITSTPSR